MIVDEHTERLREFWFESVPRMMVVIIMWFTLLFVVINYILEFESRGDLNAILLGITGWIILGSLVYRYPRRNQ